MYVARWPIFAKSKLHTQRDYGWSKYITRYGYLELSRANKLDLVFKLSDRVESLIITMPKHYVLDALLLNMMWRPIPRPKIADDKLWLHPSARKLQTQREFNQMSPGDLHKVFYDCIESMDGLVENLTGPQQEKARKQFNALQERQRYADLLYEMWKAKNYIKFNKII